MRERFELLGLVVIVHHRVAVQAVRMAEEDTGSRLSSSQS